MLSPGAVPADDRGLAYGDGLFETLRIGAYGQVPLARAHCRRMAEGARRLAIPFDEPAWWRALARLCEQGPGVGKLLLTRGSGGRGYSPPEPAEPGLFLRHHPLPRRPERHDQSGLITGLAGRLADQPALAGIKHANRLEQVLARREADRQGWDEALMLDPAGRAQCLTSMNLFAVVDGQLRTPPVDRAGVAGVMRAWLLEHAREHMELDVQVRPLTLKDLGRADEILATNAVAGVLPVATLGVWHFAPGPLTRTLMEATRELWHS